MPFTIAHKFWLPLVLISGLAAVSLVQGWTTSRPSDSAGDYRQSLKLLFETMDSTLQALQYKPHCKASVPKPTGSTADCTTPSVQR